MLLEALKKKTDADLLTDGSKTRFIKNVTPNELRTGWKETIKKATSRRVKFSGRYILVLEQKS